jgi:hypothetical protein
MLPQNCTNTHEPDETVPASKHYTWREEYIKLPLCLINHLSMKMHRGVQARQSEFLTSALNGVSRSFSYSDHFTSVSTGYEVGQTLQPGSSKWQKE